MRLRPSAIINPTPGKLLLEVNTAIEVQAAIRVDINIQGAVISRRVDESDVASLHEVVSDHDVFLVGGDLDVMRSNSWLGDGGVVEALHVREIGNIESGDVVICGQSEVGELSVLCDVGAGR